MDEAMWAFGRVSGFVSLILFTASVLLGILTRSGRPLLVLPRFSITLLHRNISAVAAGSSAAWITRNKAAGAIPCTSRIPPGLLPPQSMLLRRGSAVNKPPCGSCA